MIRRLRFFLCYPTAHNGLVAGSSPAGPTGFAAADCAECSDVAQVEAGIPKRIAIVCQGIQMGGTARIAVDLSRCWAESGWDVTLLTEHPPQSDHYAVHPSVTRVTLGYDGPHRSVFQIAAVVRRLRREMRRLDPEIAIGLGPTSGTMLAL